ncbi:MAG: nitroreductase family protein [Eubacteriales bacterium]|nr:nitroreductase family protein [Eubacteriales bacterium]
MEFLTLVKERRSIRAYKGDNTISESTLKEIISTTLQAPTWKNSETGRYYIAANKESMDAVRAALPAFNQNSTANASAFIVTAYEKNISGFTKGEADNELGNQWGAYDLGLQTSYLLLRAKELGLDSLIMGLRDAAKLRKSFNIPETQEIVSVIALGYRDGDALLRKRKEVEEVATFL